MKPYDKNHPHNAVFCEQLRSVIDGKPKTVQREAFCQWIDVAMLADGTSSSSWDARYAHRIKPLEPVMITRTVTYPAPMTVAPAIGTEYFALESSLVASYAWAGDGVDQAALTQGRSFTDKAYAQACWDALFGAQK